LSPQIGFGGRLIAGWFLPVCDQQTPKSKPEPIRRKGYCKFRPLAKLISG